MPVKVNISLALPKANKPGKYFSLRLKQEMHKERVEYPQPKKLFVVSDIEGNFQPFCKLLIKNRVIDRYLQWTFDDGHLVIVGDCFDRGEEVIECLWLIYSLEEMAKRAGGYVHFILGNHEIMNLNGDWRYVHPKYAEKKPSTKTPPTALYYGNNELWNWLCTKNIMEKIGPILFVHGGIAPVLNEFPFSLSEINNKARSHYANAEQYFTDAFLSILFNSQDSPFWYRGYYTGAATEEIIDVTLAKFGVKTIVTGHTIIDQVTPFFNGKVINVNTDHANGRSEGLLIKKNHFYRVSMLKKRERIK